MAYHPVIQFPVDPLVLDFTENGFGNPTQATYTIGRYDEIRPGLYNHDQFSHSQRCLHMGIDLGAPSGTPLMAFANGVIIDFAVHSRAGDYGPTLITEHDLDGKSLYVLWGHLSLSSLVGKTRGLRFYAGETIASIGSEKENGGWPAHVHIQLSWDKPSAADLPGVVSPNDRDLALKRYPDPRLILGPIY